MGFVERGSSWQQRAASREADVRVFPAFSGTGFWRRLQRSTPRLVVPALPTRVGVRVHDRRQLQPAPAGKNSYPRFTKPSIWRVSAGVAMLAPILSIIPTALSTSSAFDASTPRRR